MEKQKTSKATRAAPGSVFGDSIAQRVVETAARAYQRTKNPINAWRAFAECRHAGIPVPEWILEYFERSAIRIHRLSTINEKKPLPRNVIAALAECLEFKKPGKSGRGNVIKDFQNSKLLRVACMFHWYLKEDPGRVKESVACAYAARYFGVSKSTANRAWKEFGPDFHGKSLVLTAEQLVHHFRIALFEPVDVRTK